MTAHRGRFFASSLVMRSCVFGRLTARREPVMKRPLLFWSILSLLIVSGCDDQKNGDGLGTLAVFLTDAPACGLIQVNVTVLQVRVHPGAGAETEGPGWTEIVLSPPRRIDLLSLNQGFLEPLGEIPIRPGRYRQLRLVLASNSTEGPLRNSVVPEGGSETALQTPSEAARGIKVVQEFDVTEGNRANLVLDFDACRSVARKGDGTFLLRPVLSLIPQQISGEIRGVLAMALSDATAVVSPRITLQRGGERVRSVLPNPDGAFVLGPVVQSAPGGGYDVVFTAGNGATAVIALVPVAVGRTTLVGSATDPIVLDPAPMRRVSGTVTPAGGTVDALQAFPLGGPTVEVSVAAALLSDGTYSIALPEGAPSLGLFGSGALPILLTRQPSVAGAYLLKAAAEGFPAEERPITLAGVDLSGVDFDLTK